MNRIVHTKSGFNFQKGLERARRNVAYYEEDILLDVSTRIIEAMEEQGITRSELARRMEVSSAYITKILRGHANLSLESLAKVAFALGLKWECLLIPKDADLGVVLLTDGAGASVVRAVETATVEYSDDDTLLNDEADYAKGTCYDMRISA